MGMNSVMVLISLTFGIMYLTGCSGCLVVGVLIPVVAWFIYKKFTHIPKLPDIDLQKRWTHETEAADTSIRPFKIQFSDEMIADLKSRLSKAPSFAPLEGVGFEYGFNNNYLKEVLNFWTTEYNFKEREEFLNKYPQFKTNIQGLDIHYIHVKPANTEGLKVLPLLLLHGWPGSVREFYEAIPLLTTPRKEHGFVFEVIVPSLPGYGFSQAAAKPGLGSDQLAVIMRNLMERLGFQKYYIQGGDWGSSVVHNMSILFPEKITAMHTNMPSGKSSYWIRILGALWPSMVVENKYKDRLYPLIEKFQYLLEETGYMHLQATKPDTVSVALRDSPAGLAAYILEKFSTWTNKDFKKLQDGGLTRKFKLEDLLDNIMIYWTSGCITTSMRLYAETMNKRNSKLKLSQHSITVPAAVAFYKHELMYHPSYSVNLLYKNLIQVSHFEDGGHFAAFELPKTFTDDVWQAFSKVQ